MMLTSLIIPGAIPDDQKPDRPADLQPDKTGSDGQTQPANIRLQCRGLLRDCRGLAMSRGASPSGDQNEMHNDT